MRYLLSVLTITLAACTTHQLSDLAPDAELRVSGPMSVSDRPTSFYVSLVPLGLECTDLGSDLQGTVNGVPLRVVRHGESQKRRDGGLGGPSCSSVVFAGDVAAMGPGPAHIRIWDDSGSVEADYDDLFTPRTLEMIAPSDGQLFVGDQVELRWSPASDELEFYGGYFEKDGQPYLWGGEDHHLLGHTMTMTVPADVDAHEGPGFLGVTVDVAPRASRCVGVEICDVYEFVLPPPRIPVTFVNRARP